MKEMQEKIEFYKGRSEKLDELQAKNNELEKAMIRAHTDNIIKIEQVRSEMQEQFDAKFEKLEMDYRRELQEIREQHGSDLSEKENEFANLASKNSLAANYEKIIESLKSENTVSY